MISHAPTIANEYVFTLLDIIEELGGSPLELCQKEGVVVPRSGMVRMETVAQVAELLENRFDESNPGLMLGLRTGIQQHGRLGYAARASENLGDAIRIDAEYLASRATGIDFHVLYVGRNKVHLRVDIYEASSYAERFLVEFLFGTLLRCYNDLLPNQKLNADIQVAFPCPTTQERYKKLTGAIWRFSQPYHAICFDRELLSRKLSQADQNLQALLVESCEEEIRQLNLHQTLADHVRFLLKSQLSDPPSQVQVATYFGLHERTLKRKLAKEGCNYRDILIELKVARVKELLAQDDLTIEAIAHLMGYASPNSFQQLFKKWTGQSPGELRRNIKNSPSR